MPIQKKPQIFDGDAMTHNPERGPAAHYLGERGRRYHEDRLAWRSKESQASRTRYFRGFTSSTDVVLDFGCGTGGVLSHLDASRRIGIEISEARSIASEALDEVHESLSAVSSGSVDVALSFHALEHVPDPFAVLTELSRILKPAGMLRIVVPFETPLLQSAHRSWRPNDKDMHLYSWTPLTLGNLLDSAGYEVLEARIEPFSEGGKLGSATKRLLRNDTAARWIKAFLGRRFHVVATARQS